MIDTQLIVICLLTFIIHLIGTLAYSIRIAGVRTRRIAVSFALFNVLIPYLPHFQLLPGAVSGQARGEPA